MMRIDPISATLFIKNRRKLLDQLPDGALVLCGASPHILRNGDVHYPYRQDSDFFYLTGIGQEGCVFLLSHEEEILFIRQDDEKSLLWTGSGLNPEEASGLSGISDVRYLSGLDSCLASRLHAAGELFYDVPDPVAQERGGRLSGAMLHRKVMELHPEKKPSALHPILGGLRMIKEPEEVEAISQACKVAGQAFQRVLECVGPGIPEYVIEAEIAAAFISSGSAGHAYEPIIASGSNALILHYVKNSGICRTGEIVLMDFGAEWNHYASDCSRSLPVDGHFTKRQAALYRSVYRVFLQARSLMQPGIRMNEYHQKVGEIWQEEHLALGLYSMADVRGQNPQDPLWRKYFMHGTSHSLGLDVHDPLNRDRPFAEGMVLTCEPAIYLPGEGVGIRLENDILISGEGPVDLMDEIPMEPEELEERMNTRR